MSPRVAAVPVGEILELARKSKWREFLETWIKNGQRTSLTRLELGIKDDEWLAWNADAEFKQMRQDALDDLLAEVKETARQVALGGDTDMLKWYIAVHDPRWDLKLRQSMAELYPHTPDGGNRSLEDFKDPLMLEDTSEKGES